jgi:hypothetical protein
LTSFSCAIEVPYARSLFRLAMLIWHNVVLVIPSGLFWGKLNFIIIIYKCYTSVWSSPLGQIENDMNKLFVLGFDLPLWVLLVLSCSFTSPVAVHPWRMIFRTGEILCGSDWYIDRAGEWFSPAELFCQ